MKKIFFIFLIILSIVWCWRYTEKGESIYLHSISWEQSEYNKEKVTLWIEWNGEFNCRDTKIFIEKWNEKKLLFESIDNPVKENSKICPENVQMWDYKIAQISYCYSSFWDGECEALLINYNVETKEIQKFSRGIPVQMWVFPSRNQLLLLQEYYNLIAQNIHFSENDIKIYESIRSYFKEKFDTDIWEIK